MEIEGVIQRMRDRVGKPEPETIRNETHLEHRLADLLYGDSDEAEANFVVDRDILDKVLSNMNKGKKIFRSPVINGKPGKLNGGYVTLADSGKIEPNLQAIAQGKPAPIAESMRNILKNNSNKPQNKGD